MKKYAGATLRKGKTDKMDTIKIANFGIDNWFKLEKHQPQSEIYEELKFLGRQYAHYITLKVASKLALGGILDRTMPGIKSLLNSSDPENPTMSAARAAALLSCTYNGNLFAYTAHIILNCASELPLRFFGLQQNVLFIGQNVGNTSSKLSRQGAFPTQSDRKE